MRATLLASWLLSAATLAAQDTTGLQLHALHQRASGADPRAQQVALLRQQAALRLDNLSAELRPAFSSEVLAQYQSDVVHVPIPGGPVPPHDTYDARIGLAQRILDPGYRARRALISAQAAQTESAVAVRLYGNRQQVNDAFFAALLAQEQQDELRATISALEAQLALAANRVREGAALPSEEATVRAELLRRRQMLVDAGNSRVASLTVLSDLTGQAIDTTQRLAIPALERAVSLARTNMPQQARARPEYAELDAARLVLDRQDAARRAQDLPRVGAFGRAGYGRPGLNPLSETFDSYWLAGVQLQWSPFSWGATRRDREINVAQRRILDTEAEALDHTIARAVTRELATIDRLRAALALDADIIALRERIAAETQIRYTESAVTAAEVIERHTDLLAARITHAVHRVELAHASARFLTIMGLETR
ncbi:MAG TPA: TolC family protein [Gemmatimonadaceae bacterium]|nr:TolC family protein [Gemmatimonadaceae bacterium]